MKQITSLGTTMRSLKDLTLSETLELNCRRMEHLMSTQKRPARKLGKKVAGFSEHFTPGTHFSCAKCSSHLCNHTWITAHSCGRPLRAQIW